MADTPATKKKADPNLPMMKKRGSELKSALPFKFDGYTIGNPDEKNDYPGVESGIDNPDAKNFEITKNYYINCLSKHGGLVPVYKKWHNGPQQKEMRGLGNYDTMSVIYFISSSNTQYVYGTVSDGRGLTNGVPLLMESKYWDCKLHSQ